MLYPERRFESSAATGFLRIWGKLRNQSFSAWAEYRAAGCSINAPTCGANFLKEVSMKANGADALFEAATAMMCCLEGVRRESAAAIADHSPPHWGMQRWREVMAQEIRTIDQVVVFVSGGRAHAVATRRVSANSPACIVVDYDSMDDADITAEEIEMKELGYSLSEFKESATYLLGGG